MVLRTGSQLRKLSELFGSDNPQNYRGSFIKVAERNRITMTLMLNIPVEGYCHESSMLGICAVFIYLMRYSAGSVRPARKTQCNSASKEMAYGGPQRRAR